MENRIFLDIHAIQTLPPSNMNRDDTGSPKTAQYGGVRRARVSSQAWKRAMRLYFEEHSDMEIGVRTKDIVTYVSDCIREQNTDVDPQDAFAMAKKVINGAGIKTGKDDKAKALFFMGKKQAEELAAAALQGVADKAQLKEILRSNPAIDIALFGRMVADDPSLNEDASAQVAHAISTHGVQTEFDYYTAIDDMSAEDNAGAGMLGTIEYNSSTLYRYADVAVHELLRQLGGDPDITIRTLKLFIEAFVNSLPTGKINTFANQTLPQAVMINIRDDRPVNLVSAYEEPIRSSNGFAKPSVERMFSELAKTEKFVHKPLLTLYLTEQNIEGFSEGISEETLSALLEDFGSRVVSYF